MRVCGETPAENGELDDPSWHDTADAVSRLFILVDEREETLGLPHASEMLAIIFVSIQGVSRSSEKDACSRRGGSTPSALALFSCLASARSCSLSIKAHSITLWTSISCKGHRNDREELILTFTFHRNAPLIEARYQRGTRIAI